MLGIFVICVSTSCLAPRTFVDPKLSIQMFGVNKFLGVSSYLAPGRIC